MKDFERHGRIVRGANASFLTLVPKVKNPLSLSEFRPISLIGSVYRIIAKILAARLQKALPSIISQCQSGFLQGRNITDSILSASERISEMQKRGRSCAVIKVDFKKAFDRVRWSFLLSMMKGFAFSNKWLRWIKGCLSTSTVSFLVNGEPTKELEPERGLRKGAMELPIFLSDCSRRRSPVISRAS